MTNTGQEDTQSDQDRNGELLLSVTRGLQILLQAEDLRQAFDRCLAGVGESGGLDRIYIYRSHPHPETGAPAVSLEHEWAADPDFERSGFPALQNFEWKENGFSRWHELLNDGEIIAGPLSSFPDSEREALELAGLSPQSIALVPVWVGGKMWGHLGFADFSEPREWGEPEREALRTLAAGIGSRLNQHEQETRRELQHYALEKAGNAVLLVGRDSVIRYANQKACDMLGYSKSELEGLKVEQLNPELGEAWEEYWEETREQLTRSYETFALNQAGEEIPVEVDVRHLEYEGEEYHYVIGRDLRESRWVEQLQEEQERSRVILEQLPAVFWTTDEDLRFTSSRGRGVGKIEPDSGEQIGKSLTEYFGLDDPDHPILKNHRKALDGESVNYVYEHLGRVFLTFLEPRKNLDGEIEGVIGVAHDVTEREKAERKLRESRRRFQTLVSNLPGMVYRCQNDEHWTMDFVSDGCRDLIGVEPEEFASGEVLYADLVHPEDLPELRETVNRQVEQQETFICEYRIITPGGEEKWVWERGKGVYDESGELLYLEGFISDITERKEAEEELRLLSSAVEQSSEAILITDNQLDPPGPTITYVNSAMEEMTGYSREELIGENPRMLQGPETEREVLDDIREGLEAGEPVSASTINYRKDGTPYHLQWHMAPVRDESGEIQYWISLQRDVTERKRMQRELRESRRRMETLLSNLPGMVYRCRNEEGWPLEYVSDGCRELTGYDPDELVEEDLSYQDLVHPEDYQLLMEEIDRALETGRTFEHEYRIRTKSGEDRWILERGRAIFNQEDSAETLEGFVSDVTEKHRAQEELRQERDLLRGIMQTGPTAVLVVRSDGELEFANERALEMIGPEIGEMATVQELNEFYNFRAPEFSDTEFDSPFLRLKQEDGPLYNMEYCLGTGEDLRYLSISAAPLRNEQGEVERYISVSQDITDRIERERKLRENERKFRLMTENVSDVIAQLNQEGEIEYISPSVERVMGYDQQELLGETPMDRAHPDDVRSVEDVLQRIGEESTVSVTWRYRASDGDYIWLESTGRAIKDPETGEVSAIQTVSRDVTERVEQRNLYETLLSALSEMGQGLTITRGKRMEFVNPALAEMTGYSREELKALESYLKLVAEDERDRLSNFTEQRKRGEQAPSSYESKLLRKSGEEIDVRIAVEQLEIGEDIHQVVLVRDISQRKRMEKQLRQAQRMESIGQLAGGVAHDFNNLLTGILGYANLAKEELPGDHTVQTELSEIERAGNRAAELTQKLLTFSRQQQFEAEEVNLNHLLRDVRNMLESLLRENTDLVFELAEDIGPVHIDPGSVEQMVVNLAANAEDAMTDGGKVEIKTANVYLDREYAENHAECEPGHYVLLQVSDEGEGMSEEVQKRIFEPFFTTKEVGQGTGLGLSTVYGIVKQNDGHIWVYSEPGMGSTFKIYLPRAESAVSPDEEPEEQGSRQAELTPGRETVLLVEDEETVRRFAGRALREQGYQVIEAEDGNEAVQIYAANDGKIDLMVSDVVMPGRTGPELAKELLQEDADLRLLFISGYTNPPETAGSFEGIPTEILEKPFSTEDLVKRVQQLLERGEAGQEGAEA